MYKLDEKRQIESVRGALALRSRIEQIVDDVCNKGFKNICWLGIGGTWASCLQVVCHMKERTALEVFSANAAEYCTTGDRRIGKGTFMVFSSVSGTTVEVVEAVRKARDDGAVILGFVDAEDSPLAEMVDNRITYPANEQLKFFMVADRFLYDEGAMPEYEDMYVQFDEYLPEALVEAEKSADGFGEEFARAHMSDALHYYVGAGTLYGATYSYGMCYMEEMHWLRTKSIHSAEFFHGMLEIIDEDTPVTLFIGEDSQRSLGERVKRFLKDYSKNYTVIDTRDYELPGIDDRYRYAVSHLVMHAVTNRIDAYLEELTGHDMTVRKFYRKVDY